MNKVMMILSLTLSAHAFAAGRVSSVPSCNESKMILTSSGWAVAAGHRVDWHGLLEDPGVAGVPDAIYQEIDYRGGRIAVCQAKGNLVYSITR